MSRSLPELSLDEVVERLVAVTAERDSLLSVLRGRGRDEGDASLVHQVVIWRARAEQADQRHDAAARALAALRGHWVEAPAEIDAWKRATNQPARRAG